MSEIPDKTELGLEAFNPLCIRNKVIEAKLLLHESFGWNSLNPSNPSRPYVIREVEGLAEAGGLSTADEFRSRLEELGKEYYELLVSERVEEAKLVSSKLEAIRGIYECLRFFWEEDGLFDLGALYEVQRVTNYPLWNDDWRFTNQVKPPKEVPSNGDPTEEFYKKLEVGSRVKLKVASEVSNKSKSNEISGEVIGFQIGFFAQFLMGYLIVHFKDDSNWIHQSYLQHLDFDYGQ